MRLRLTDRQVRFRLEEPDLPRLRDEERVAVRVPLSDDASFEYALTFDAGVSALEARWRGHGLELRVPAEQGRRWLASGEVRLEGQQATGGDQPLELVVDKDLGCGRGSGHGG